MIHKIYQFYLTRNPQKKRSYFSNWLYWQIFKYLNFFLFKYYENLSNSKIGIDQQGKIIVSLTSYPARIDTVYLSIKSILNQSLRPKKVILWLTFEEFPNKFNGLPLNLLVLRSTGLEIQFCNNLKAHNKYFYAFQQYPDDLIVTIDDDVFYPRDTLKILFNHHKVNPECLIANRVRKMSLDKKFLSSYRSWKINCPSNTGPSKKLFATGVGGVLYQPRFFDPGFFNQRAINELNCWSDDVWLKAGQLKNQLDVVFTNVFYEQFIQIRGSQEQSLFKQNVFNSDNDRQLKDVFRFFRIDTSFLVDD